MNINIKTTSFELTEAISDYASKRLNALAKFFEGDESVKCDVELARTTNHHKNGDIFAAEVHIVAKEKNFYARVEKEDLYSAIDEVKDTILREVKNSKGKSQSMMRRGGAKVKNIIKGLWPLK